MGLSAAGDTNYFAGNVGVGTAAPMTTVHVQQSDGSYPDDANNHLVVESSSHSYIGLGGGTSSDVGIHFGDSGAMNQGRVAYKNSSDSMYFSTDGTERMMINSSGNVGIGNTSPAGRLAICGTTDNDSACSLVVYNSAGTLISQIRDDGCAYFSNDTTVMGNLSVHGDLIYIDTAVTVTSALSVINSGTGPALFVAQDGLQPIAHFIDRNGDDIIFDDNGRVGIGTASPSVQLDVYNSSGWGGIDVDGRDGGEIKLQRAGTTYLDMYANHSGSVGSVIKATDHLHIATNNSTAAGTATYFKNDGTVGIGTVYPTEKLTVAGNISAQGGLSASGDVHIGNDGNIIFTGGATTDKIQSQASYFVLEGDSVVLRNRGGTEDYAKFVCNGPVCLYYNNLIRVETANPGVNITGSLTAAPATNTSFVSKDEDRVILGQVAANRPVIGLDSAGSTYTNAMWGIENNDGNLNMFRQGLDALWINNSGEVGIGTTAPSEKLTVAGAISARNSITTGGFLYATCGRFSNDVCIGGNELFFPNDAASAYIRAADALFIESDYDNDDTGGKPIYFYTSGSEKVRIDGDGDVGIGLPGTTNSNRLHVSGGDSQVAVAKITRKCNSASNNTYTFEVDSSAHTSNMTLGGAMAVDVNEKRAFTINGLEE